MYTHRATGRLDGVIAVIIFSAMLPLTRLALEGLSPLQIVFGCALIGAFAALFVVNVANVPFPGRHQLAALSLVSVGGVFAFPFFVAVALDGRDAASGAIPMALVPLTAIAWSWLRGHETLPRGFMFWTVASILVMLHALGSGIVEAAPEGLTAAVIVAITLEEGRRLARQMPGWQVMAWALLMGSPAAALGFGYTWAHPPTPVTSAGWMAFALLTAAVPLGAIRFWSLGLATRAIHARRCVTVLPLGVLLWSTVLTGERVSPELWLYAGMLVAAGYLAQSGTGARLTGDLPGSGR